LVDKIRFKNFASVQIWGLYVCERFHNRPGREKADPKRYLKPYPDNSPENIRNRRRPRLLRIPYRLDLEAYKRMRSSVERFFAWLTNGFRRLTIRWERLASTFIRIHTTNMHRNIPKGF
jgi:hypothetical protein